MQDNKLKIDKKTIHMINLGCPKNLVDGEIMLGSLMKDGYTPANDAEGAETVVINTCGFIDDAKKESISKILEVADLKSSGKVKNLIVAGCLAQRYKEDLTKELPEADLFIGSGSFQNITQILNDATAGKAKRENFHLPTYLQQEDTPRVNSEPFYRAYLKISEGCKKRCAFCAIPKIRGNLQSRSLKSIVNEAKLLVAGGVRELNVISHDFTDYGWDLRREDKNRIESPYELLSHLSDVPGLDWIRVLYLYPDGFDKNMIRLIKERANLTKYFDMPLQHINNEVLKNMNRKMENQKIKDILAMIRSEIPDSVIRTQFIVGFPGETEAQFEELMEFVEEQRFDRVGCFTYSPEDNTPAGKMSDQIDEKIKQKRFHKLMKLQMGISREIHQKYIGQTLKVIVDGPSEETDLLLEGRTSQQAPNIDGVVLINDGTAKKGEMVDVMITEAQDYDLVGHIVKNESN